MKRLVFIVEGDTEVSFVDNQLIPYLYGQGFQNPMNAQTIITNRRQHSKGGVQNYPKFKNEIVRTLSQGNVLVTTLIDFFRLPTDFPNYTTDSTRIADIESAIRVDLDNNPYVLPYIQKYEIESLMFSEISGFDFIIDNANSLEKINAILSEYNNPEDINGGELTAPSKRLERIFSYDKVVDSQLIFEMMDFNNILLKCPRFQTWVKKLINLLSENGGN